MANPVEGDSANPKIPGVQGKNSAAASTADSPGVLGTGGAVGVAGFGTQVGIFGFNPFLVPGFVAVRGDGGGIPGLGGAAIPTFGVIGTSLSQTGIGVQGVNQSGGVAGDFQGSVNVNGNMTVSGNINVSGDVFLTNKDLAEYFDVDISSVDCEVGMVMVLGEAGALVPCSRPYDKRAIGVVSGAGGLRPAITLGAVETSARTVPIALVGTAFCLVDADFGSIEAGDPVTSSETPGHAMRATDPVKAFCAIIGKALAPLHKGRGAIPVLIARQ